LNIKENKYFTPRCTIIYCVLSFVALPVLIVFRFREWSNRTETKTQNTCSKFCCVGSLCLLTIGSIICVYSHNATKIPLDKEISNDDIMTLEEQLLLLKRQAIRRLYNGIMEEYKLTKVTMETLLDSKYYKSEIKELSALPKFLEFRGTWNITKAQNTIHIKVPKAHLRKGIDVVIDWGDGEIEHIKTGREDKLIQHRYSTDDLERADSNRVYELRIKGKLRSAIFDVRFANGTELKNRAKLKTVSSLGYLHWESFDFTFYNCDELIEVQGGFTHDVTSMNFMFGQCANLTTVDIKDWDVSNVKDMAHTFHSCINLTTVETKDWNVSNVKDMNFMFFNCAYLTTVNLKDWKVSNVKGMSYMFFRCMNLTTVETKDWDVSNVTNMHFMFYNCTNLTTVNSKDWNLSKDTRIFRMFDGCTKLPRGNQCFTDEEAWTY